MRLEDEIKQSKFASAKEKLVVNILYTNSWLNRNFHQVLKEYDISQQQYNILRILRGQHPNPASVNLLTERMIDKMSNASRLVEKLRQKELLLRKECKADRRQVDVLITDKGLDMLKILDKKLKELRENSLNSISETEIEHLNNLLDKLRN